MRVDVLDLPSQNIRKHFDAGIAFIGQSSVVFWLCFSLILFSNLDNALLSKSNNVLVHCSAGISRSPTLVLAYMIKTNHWTLDEAFDKMRKLRRIVDPNVSFMIQLREWEKAAILAVPSATANINDDSAAATSGANIRPTSNTYCGSTSKTKTDTKARTEAAIVVN